MAKKEISRRDFLKGAAAGTAMVAGFGILSACSNTTNESPSPSPSDSTTPSSTPSSTPSASGSSSLYTPGTYQATAKGAVGTVLVTMTFSEDAITDVVLDVSAETESIGGAAGDTLRQAILDNQSAEIDAVSGATLTTKAVMEAADKCIKQAKGEIPVEVIGGGDSGESGPAGWLGEEPEITDIAETWDTDFLIVGAGNGGLCAGAYAARQGLKFRIIEKSTAVAKVRGWYGACDSEDAQALGEAPMDRAAMRRSLKLQSSGKTNLKIWDTWFNESAAMHKFIKECYADYLPDAKVEVTVGAEATWPDKEGLYFPVEEHFWGFGEVNRNDIFQKVIEEEGGVPIDFSTTLVKLEKSGNKVTGVIAQNTDTGKYIRINASKGVLLACGGYPYNTDMMEQLDPVGTAVTTFNNGLPTDTGDGIKAGVWAGAAMQGESAPMLFDRGIVAPGVDAGYTVTSTGDKVFPATSGQFNIGSQPFLKVNRKGQRFTNESGTYDMLSYAAYNQPGGVYAIIFDDNFFDDVQRFHTIGCSAGTRNGSKERTLEQIESKIEIGEAFKADTLEELADKLGFTGEAKDTFLATCERYNELYDKQDDVDFGKLAYRLSALRQAPYYGFWMGACLLTTEQGLLCDENARVLNTDRDPIDGLFVCGDNAGGFFVNNYPCQMAGIAMGRNMTFAIKAVKVAYGLEG